MDMYMLFNDSPEFMPEDNEMLLIVEPYQAVFLSVVQNESIRGTQTLITKHLAKYLTHLSIHRPSKESPFIMITIRLRGDGSGLVPKN